MSGSSADSAPAELRRAKLWDLPVRVVHWSFALLIPAMWWTWKSGQMPLHRTLGHVLLALLLFRLFWGVAGSRTARFTSFVRGPRAILAYLRAGEPAAPGHNPLGALSVIALLALLGLQIGLGLFTQDVDGEQSGPLTPWVSYETADAMRGWHELVFYILLGFIALHLLAVLFYLTVKRDNLVAPMVTGRKRMATMPGGFAPAWRVAVGAAAAGGIAWWVSLGCPGPWSPA